MYAHFVEFILSRVERALTSTSVIVCKFACRVEVAVEDVMLTTWLHVFIKLVST